MTNTTSPRSPRRRWKHLVAASTVALAVPVVGTSITAEALPSPPTLHVWVDDSVSPAAYYVGTSCTDDSRASDSTADAALQAAANGIATNGKIYVCPGDYGLTATVVVSQLGVTLEGIANANGDRPEINRSASAGGSIRLITVLDTAMSFTVKSLKLFGGSATDGDDLNPSIADDGGAIYAGTAALDILDSQLVNNTAAGRGGAVSAGTVTIDSTYLVENTADGGDGGAVYASGETIVFTSTFEANGASATGGAVYSVGDFDVTNSTFVDNTAATGAGAAASENQLLVKNSTFVGNSATTASGGMTLAAVGENSGLRIVNTNSIFVSSTPAPVTVSPNCVALAGYNSDNGGNFDSAAAGTASPEPADGCVDSAKVTAGTSFAGVNPVDLDLGSLADNGGPTPTVALGADSDAIGKGVTAQCAYADQRLTVRLPGQPCDSGAYEYVDEVYVWTGSGTYWAGPGCGNGAYLEMVPSAAFVFQAVADRIADGGTIHVCDGTFPLTRAIDIDVENLTIVGEDGSRPVIAGPTNSRLFAVADSVAAFTVENLEMKDAAATDGNALAVTAADHGGAIYALHADITIDNSVFFLNVAAGSGGAIYTESGSVSASNTLFLNNVATTGAGGAIAAVLVTIDDSTFVDNSAGGNGGAVAISTSIAEEVVTVRYSTFDGNTAGGSGGAIAVPSGQAADLFQVLDSTFVDNSATGAGAGNGLGGAVRVEVARTAIIHSTFVDNTSTNGGNSVSTGVFGLTWPGTGVQLSIGNSIFSGTADGPNCVSEGGLDDVGGNLDTAEVGAGPNSAAAAIGCVDPAQTASTGGVAVIDLDLGVLGDNGGPTDTIALGADSIAIDYGADAACLEVDQRGEVRSDGFCDSGAYEASGATPIDEAWVWPFDTGEGFDYGAGTSCGDETYLAAQPSASVAFQTVADRLNDAGVIYVCDGYYGFDATVTIDADDVTIQAVSFPNVVVLTPKDNPVQIDGDFEVRLFDVTSTAFTVRGLTLSAGYADGEDPAEQNGGAINAPSATVNVDTVAFDGNHAAGYGGAIYANEVNVAGGEGSPEVLAAFSYNIANFLATDPADVGGGGAIYAVSSASVANSVFALNFADGDSVGGAIFGQTISVDRSAFFLNTTGTNSRGATPTERSGAGGALGSDIEDSHFTIADSAFMYNGAFTSEGGTFAATSPGGGGSIVEIQRSTVSGSGIIFPLLGGGIDYSVIGYADKGGAAHVGYGQINLTNVSILGSYAIEGGALSVDDGAVSLLGVGIKGAVAVGEGDPETADGIGAAILTDSSVEAFSVISGSYFDSLHGATGCSFPLGGMGSDNTRSSFDTTCGGSVVDTADLAVTADRPFTVLPSLELGFFGGVTLGLDDTSVLIDAIGSSDPTCMALIEDQTRVARPIGTGCDIGPWEAYDETVLTGTTGTFTVPGGVTSLDVLLVGGGGGGGTSTGIDAAGRAGGGGGGGDVLVCTITVSPGDVLSYAIGGGGAVGVNGDDTLFDTCTASGGVAGDGTDGGASGNGNSGGAGGLGGDPAGSFVEAGGGGGGASTSGEGVLTSPTSAEPGDGGLGITPASLPAPGAFASVTTQLGGGGGGGVYAFATDPVPPGSGNGGGGDGGAIGPGSLSNGTDGTGGGGGGSTGGGSGGAGGSGTIVIRHSIPLDGVPTEITTQVSRTSIPYGSTISDTATVVATPDPLRASRIAAADLPAPTGDVDWYYCYDSTTTPASCDEESGTYIDTVVLGIDGIATLSNWTPADGVGEYLFHAVYRGDDTYLPSYDDGTNEDFTVTKAVTTLLYTGVQYYLAGTTSVVLAVQAGPSACRTGDVTFTRDIDGDGVYETLLGTGTVNPSTGVATYTMSVSGGTIIDVRAEYPETANCAGAVVTSAVIVAGTGDTSNGGGTYSQNGKVNFGYSLQVKSTRTGTTVTGQMLWHVNGKVRIKGTIGSYTKQTCPSQAPSLSGAICGFISGSGSVYVWNDGGKGWTRVSTGVGFRVFVGDGGTATVCVKKTCSTTLKPDFFRMDVPTQTLAGESLTLQQLNGGNLIVK